MRKSGFHAYPEEIIDAQRQIPTRGIRIHGQKVVDVQAKGVGEEQNDIPVRRLGVWRRDIGVDAFNLLDLTQGIA